VGWRQSKLALNPLKRIEIMQVELRRPKALSAKHQLKVGLDAAQLRRSHVLSTDVADRIVKISRTMDQANAIAELMK
jgi:hypothetical protein